MSSLTKAERAEMERRYDAAKTEVFGLCNGSRTWTMRVPVDEDHDSDRVILNALNDLLVLLAHIEAREIVLARLEELEIVTPKHIANMQAALQRLKEEEERQKGVSDMPMGPTDPEPMRIVPVVLMGRVVDASEPVGWRQRALSAEGDLTTMRPVLELVWKLIQSQTWNDLSGLTLAEWGDLRSGVQGALSRIRIALEPPR